VETIDRADSTVAIKFRQKAKVDPMHIIGLVQERGDLTLVPPNTLKLDLKHREPGTGIGEPENAMLGPRFPAPGSRQAKPRTQAKLKQKPSWWTVRATAGEVTPGFTKAEILRAAPEDPRAPEGVLVKVTELLEELQS
jgi:hypothetical protein